MLRFRVRSYSYITGPTTAPRASRRSPLPHVNQHVASQHELPGHPVPWIRGDHRGRLAVDSSCPPRRYPPYHPQIERGGTGHYRSEWRRVCVQCRGERDQAVDRGSLLVGIADCRELPCKYVNVKIESLAVTIGPSSSIESWPAATAAGPATPAKRCNRIVPSLVGKSFRKSRIRKSCSSRTGWLRRRVQSSSIERRGSDPFCNRRSPSAQMGLNTT